MTEDPNDLAKCSGCGCIEHIHLLDGVLDAEGQDTGQLKCIACYGPGWAPCSVDHLNLSVRPELATRYERWASKEPKPEQQEGSQ